jgi:hypothetical protein
METGHTPVATQHYKHLWEGRQRYSLEPRARILLSSTRSLIRGRGRSIHVELRVRTATRSSFSSTRVRNDSKPEPRSTACYTNRVIVPALLS